MSAKCYDENNRMMWQIMWCDKALRLGREILPKARKPRSSKLYEDLEKNIPDL